jgi:DNA-binding transcriptional LysR family regulator
MASDTSTLQAAVAAGVSLGIGPEVAQAVAEAYQRLSAIAGRRYDPATWSRTVWLAEADRWRRSPDRDTFINLVLHLEQLRTAWEAKADRDARGWQPGVVGERLTKT